MSYRPTDLLMRKIEEDHSSFEAVKLTGPSKSSRVYVNLKNNVVMYNKK